MYLVWGSTYLAIRIAVADIPPGLLAGIRFIIAGLVLGAAALLRGQALPRGRVNFTVDPEDTTAIRIAARFDHPLDNDSRCYLLHGRVRGYEAPSSHLPLEPIPLPAGARQSIDHLFQGFYSSGSRIMLALECELPRFPMPVRLASTRVTL